jgi:hypothetical protein
MSKYGINSATNGQIPASQDGVTANLEMIDSLVGKVCNGEVNREKFFEALGAIDPTTSDAAVRMQITQAIFLQLDDDKITASTILLSAASSSSATREEATRWIDSQLERYPKFHAEFKSAWQEAMSSNPEINENPLVRSTLPLTLGVQRKISEVFGQAEAGRVSTSYKAFRTEYKGPNIAISELKKVS